MARRRFAAALSIRYRGPHPCRLAIATGTTVAEACALGGVNQAKREMKRILRAAKAKGLRYDCDTCHAAGGDFSHLHPDARDRFDRMLEVTRT